MLIFDAFLLYKKVTHSLRRTFVGKRNLHVQNYGFAFEKAPKRLPRIIWIFWDKPLEEAPEVVRASVDSWQRKNPNWQLQVLSDSNIGDYVTIPEASNPRKPQWKADLIRVALLSKYGGVWVDATTFCAIPLDEWLPPLMQSGFFAFPDTYPGRVMQNWFLAATPGNHLVERWEESMFRYYQKPGKLFHYFWVMYMFEFVIRLDSRAADVWDQTPKISAKGPALLKRIITQKDLAQPIPEHVDLNAIPVLKISSGTKTDDAEFLEAIMQRRDIDLRKMIDNVVSSKGGRVGPI